MLKKSRKKQRGVQKGVAKHRIAFHESQGSLSRLINLALSLKKLKYLNHFAKVCFFSTINMCINLALVPFTLNSERKLVVASRRRRALHYFLMTLMLALAVHRILVTIQAAGTHGKGLETYLCAAYAIVVTLGICGSLGTTVQCIETIQLFNSAQNLLDPLDNILDKEIDPFDRPLFCLKILASTGLYYTAGLNAAFFSLIFESLPMCVYPFLMSNDLIPDIGLPSLAWRVLVFPSELMTTLPPMYIAGLNLKMGLFGMELLPIYLEGLRSIKTRTLGQWEQVHHLFHCLRIGNIMFGNFIKLLAPPTLFAVASAVIIVLYVTIRPADLPMFVYCGLPLIAVVTMSVQGWIMYDAVNLKRGSEELEANHEDRTSPVFNHLPPVKKKELLLRARLLRPVVIPVGEFSELSFELLVNTWDEIISQLVFLLTL